MLNFYKGLEKIASLLIAMKQYIKNITPMFVFFLCVCFNRCFIEKTIKKVQN